ncbi:MAG: hypothetical protein CVV33_09920 [Methanomicrobiales archaeon HGW-Methanomicrobiales-4]|nr:MAG: hypothetical protein CVV33_09920 [Methanomicrobiales archaeon HGW-Methanomicrobiales-4]
MKKGDYSKQREDGNEFSCLTDEWARNKKGTDPLRYIMRRIIQKFKYIPILDFFYSSRFIFSY